MKQILIFVTLVAFGGALGAICRYIVHIYITTKFNTDFPHSTLIVNAVGCFLIGVFMTLIIKKYT